MSVQLATRLSEEEAQTFRAVTKRLGTTPSDALRMFVSAFNRCRGFPYDVRLEAGWEPFASDEEAQQYIDAGLWGDSDEAW